MSNYYVEASRLRSEVKENTNNNSWEYKLDTGLKIPAGSTVQITNSFINKQGITNNSIELSEDVEETFQVGFTVPQSAMFLQKPERTGKDDRLLTSVLEDPDGSLGLQVGESNTVLTNYYDGMVQHNLLYSGGLEIFDVFNNILSISDSGLGLSIVLEDDTTSITKPGVPIVIRNLRKRDADGNMYDDLRGSAMNNYYMRIVSQNYNGGSFTTTIVTDIGVDKYHLDNGDYSDINDDPTAGVWSPNILSSNNYSSMFGLAFINSLVGTKEDGTTLYEQQKLAKQDFAWENASQVPALPNQIDGINYQAGINSDIPCEEFRRSTANPFRDPVFNSKQTEQENYDFDRGSYCFYFAPSSFAYNAGTNQLDFSPYTDTLISDNFLANNPGLNGHTIRKNCNSLTIDRTASLPQNKSYDIDGGEHNFFPFIDTIPTTEYSKSRSASIPKPAQPAKFKDTFSPQVDYLRNGFSYDCAPARVELFTADGMSMINYGGQENPFQPNIYQDKEGQTLTPTTLVSLNSSKFLDRVVLSQTMISGLYNREDSFPYVKRTVNFDTQNLTSEEAIRLHLGMIIVGNIDATDQTDAVRISLFPHNQYRGELDSELISTQNVYKSSTIRIACIIRGIDQIGTTSATITDLQPLTNLQINGAVISSFVMSINNEAPLYTGTDAGSQVTFQGFEPYGLSEMDVTITITDEDFTDEMPQMIPIFSAKGMASELKGNTQNDINSVINDADLGGGDRCKFNYFMDTMHNQTDLNVSKMIGEDYYINPNVVQNFQDFNGENLYRVASTPAFNYNATVAGERESDSQEKRIFIRQRPTSYTAGIHPRRNFQDGQGTTSFTTNMKNIQTANYLFGSTHNCSMGSMRPPADKSFSDGQVVMKVPQDTNHVPQPENNGITSLAYDLENFDPDDDNTMIKIKKTTQRNAETVPRGILRPLPPVDPITNPAVSQDNPLGNLNSEIVPNCGSALGDFEAYPYSTPSYDMMDTGGSGDDLCLVQLQALVEDRDNNYGDYILRPLTSDITITIPKGVYSIQGFLDKFNSQIKDLDKNDNAELSHIDNFKTVRKFLPLGGNALTGGQVTLLNDFNQETHQRTIYSADPDAEFNINPLVIAVSVQTYNDLVRAWQYCGGDPFLVSYYLSPLDASDNCYHNTTINKTIGGGSYVWKNFRDRSYWSEFVDKYSDSIESLISDTEGDEIENKDIQFYFAVHRNGDDAVAAPNDYGAQTVLGEGDGLQSVANPATDSLSLISGDTVPKIDKIRKYNSTTQGIYVGSPDFELTFNPDEQLFALDGLHYAFRNPSVDLTGESAFPASSEGQPAILYRTLSQLIAGNYSVSGVDANLDDYIANALQKPLDQISGVFIYNMSKPVSQEYGNFVDENSNNMGRTFRDYFTDDVAAAEAWKNTLWYRLGFQYDTFNTRQNNNLASYYLNPSPTADNLESDNFAYHQETYLQNQVATLGSGNSVKLVARQILISQEGDPNLGFNDVSTILDDNYLPGVKTSSEFDIRSIPSIASLPAITEGPQNEIVRLYNNASMSSVRSMSGGYVYYPMKLASNDTFDATVNYTVQNISTGDEGWIFQANRGGITPIIEKSGSAIPSDEQLLYERPYQFDGSVVGGYNPTSYYRDYYLQLVSAPDYPVEYKMTNTAYGTKTPFRFAQKSAFNISNGVYRDRTFNLAGSMFLASQSTPIDSESNDITAGQLATLTTEGHYIITSDLVKKLDSINGSDQIPILGVVPLSSLSSQDFITAFGDIIHTIDQDTVLNSVKIEILNPDLTAPFLQPNSSVMIKITLPELGIPPQIEDKEGIRKRIEKARLAGSDVV